MDTAKIDMNKCLITGSTGLIGSHLVDDLHKDWDIIGISRPGSEKKHESPHVSHLNIDFSRDWDTQCLPARIDAVIHLAQSEYYRDFPNRAEDIYRVNTEAMMRLLEYARKAGAKSFVLASSGGLYGYGDHEFSEEEQISSRGDLGFYLGTKLCCEVLAESYSSFMNIIILRFFFVYGPHQKSDRLIPRLVQSIQEGWPVNLDGKDGIRINPTYVSDAVSAIRHSLNLDRSQKINIGGPENLTLRKIGEIIGKEIGKGPLFHVRKDTEPRHLVGDVHKMTELLGSPAVTFKEGISQYLTQSFPEFSRF